jgi:hypothetical protein
VLPASSLVGLARIPVSRRLEVDSYGVRRRNQPGDRLGRPFHKASRYERFTFALLGLNVHRFYIPILNQVMKRFRVVQFLGARAVERVERGSMCIASIDHPDFNASRRWAKASWRNWFN